MVPFVLNFTRQNQDLPSFSTGIFNGSRCPTFVAAVMALEFSIRPERHIRSIESDAKLMA